MRSWTKKISKLTLPSLSKFDNKEIISDPRQIAEQFCRYFTDIGPSLARNIPVSQKSHRHFLSEDFINSLYFDKVSEHEVVNICSTLRSNKARSFDNISTSLIKKNFYFN